MPDSVPAVPRLRVVRVNGDDSGSPCEWRFENENSIRIGRAQDSDIRLAWPKISRLHATVQFDGEHWQCSCTGRNGTFLNGEVVPAVRLKDGMVLEFTADGPQLEFFVNDDAPIEADESVDGDVTVWLEQLADGNSEPATRIYEHYFERIANLARRRMSPAYRRVTDEEDVAQSVMQSLFEGISRGRYPELSSRENLWRLLVVMTARKAINVVEKQRAMKRGGGRVRGESILQTPDQIAAGLDQFQGSDTTPDFLMELAEESNKQLARLPEPIMRQIARLKMEGYTNAEIAEQLNTTTRTIERKLQKIREVWSTGEAE